MYTVGIDIKDTTKSNASASYLDLLLSIGRNGQLHTSIYYKSDAISISQIFRSWIAIYVVFLSHSLNDIPRLASNMDVLF